MVILESPLTIGMYYLWRLISLRPLANHVSLNTSATGLVVITLELGRRAISTGARYTRLRISECMNPGMLLWGKMAPCMSPQEISIYR